MTIRPRPAGALRVAAITLVAVAIGLAIGIPLQTFQSDGAPMPVSDVIVAALIGYAVAIGLIGLYYLLVARQSWSIDDNGITVTLWGRTVTIPPEEIVSSKHWWIAIEFTTRIGFRSRLVFVTPTDRDAAAERLEALLGP